MRAGHHCTMPLMEKMGWSATARASFYLYNTEDDVDALIAGPRKSGRGIQTLIWRRSTMLRRAVPRLLEWTTSTGITSSTTTAIRETSGISKIPTRSPRTSIRCAAIKSAWNCKSIDGEVADVRFSGKGCAISQASASMLTETRQRQDARRVAKLSKDVRARKRRHRHQPDAHEVRDARPQSAQERRGRRTGGLARRRLIFGVLFASVLLWFLALQIWNIPTLTRSRCRPLAGCCAPWWALWPRFALGLLYEGLPDAALDAFSGLSIVTFCRTCRRISYRRRGSPAMA